MMMPLFFAKTLSGGQRQSGGYSQKRFKKREEGREGNGGLGQRNCARFSQALAIYIAG